MYEEAYSILAKLIQIKENQGVTYNGLGLIYENKNNLKLSKNCFKQALENDPNNIVYLFNYSSILKQLNLLDESLIILQKAYELDKNN